MGRGCGGYIGGGTTFSGKDASWFSPGSTVQGSTRGDAGNPPPRSREEQAAYDAFARSRASAAPTVLIPQAEARRMRDERRGKLEEAKRQSAERVRMSKRRRRKRATA